MDFKRIAACALIGTTLVGCQGTGPKQTGGALLGGAAGALVGSQFGGGTGQLVGVALGTMLGAFAGSEIGANLDASDRQIADRTAQNAFENARAGQVTTWRNPDSGHSGAIRVTKTYEADQGYCREFSHKVIVGGKAQEAYGTACRQPDGSWKIVQ